MANKEVINQSLLIQQKEIFKHRGSIKIAALKGKMQDYLKQQIAAEFFLIQLKTIKDFFNQGTAPKRKFNLF